MISRLRSLSHPEIFSHWTLHYIAVINPISRFSRIGLFTTSRWSTYRAFLALEFVIFHSEIFSYWTFHFIEAKYPMSRFSRIRLFTTSRWNTTYRDLPLVLLPNAIIIWKQNCCLHCWSTKYSISGQFCFQMIWRTD